LNQFSVSKLDVKLNGYALFSYDELKFVHLHVVQYHLQCIALEQAPTKWVCEACEASGGAQEKCAQKWYHIAILGNVPDYVVS